MKIVFSDNTLWGLLNFRIAIIEYLAQAGHQIVLVAPNDSMCDTTKIPANVRFVPVEMSRTGTNPINDLKYYKALKSIYSSERPDYIFHYTIKPNIYGTLAAKSLGIRSSAMIAGLGHVYSCSGIGNKIARTMYKYAMQFSENVFVLNSENRDLLIARKVVAADKLIWLEGGEGINLQQFTPLDMPSNEKPVFLMICRVLYEKGYAEYVEVAKSLQGKATFRIMGSIDPHPSAVSRKTIDADVASGAIEYVEFSPDVKSQIVSADCIVLPSYHEGLSRVLMEALALGRPIITTNIAGCRETVRDGENGFLCKPKDTQSLKECFLKFVDLSRQQKQAMAIKSHQLAQDIFDDKKVVAKFEQIIKN